jgi:hypothetical protein
MPPNPGLVDCLPRMHLRERVKCSEGSRLQVLIHAGPLEKFVKNDSKVAPVSTSW